LESRDHIDIEARLLSLGSRTGLVASARSTSIGALPFPASFEIKTSAPRDHCDPGSGKGRGRIHTEEPARSPRGHSFAQSLGETGEVAARMIFLRRSKERRHVQNEAHDTWMTFDPDNPVDPFRKGFHALQSFNEEHLAPETGLLPHAQSEIEIITYVREGSLVHQDGSGRLSPQNAGEFRHASAREGTRHRSLNASVTDSAQVFQGLITPGTGDPRSTQEGKRFPTADREGVLRLVVSPDGKEESLRIPQDVRLYSSVLLLGRHVIHELAKGRGAWLHVVKGRVLLRDHDLRAGDGAALDGEMAVAFTAREAAEVLLFDLA